MTRIELEKEYFEWLRNLVCDCTFAETISYDKLLAYLHDVEFTFIILKDGNRAEDGVDLRYRFADERCPELYYDEVDELLSGPCSVLEMMIALALRCEETIMDDTEYGDRTGQWFWNMIVNLGLGDMMDSRFDFYHVEDVIAKFVNREYEPDGRGGLFRVRHCDYDMRDIEIWIQMMWYLDEYYIY